eukprot:TRINITY_DN13960_c0_g1_i1.p1 TRINITY_DN13960_c0_g1~~TRINITY_DN13960_c0_g1_i1.p1  ORF type:complete len:477 (+),score=97.70 TRINITY_DN13960_c0_g1_i1:250-1680(+)
MRVSLLAILGIFLLFAASAAALQQRVYQVQLKSFFNGDYRRLGDALGERGHVVRPIGPFRVLVIANEASILRLARVPCVSVIEQDSTRSLNETMASERAVALRRLQSAPQKVIPEATPHPADVIFGERAKTAEARALELLQLSERVKPTSQLDLASTSSAAPDTTREVTSSDVSYCSGTVTLTQTSGGVIQSQTGGDMYAANSDCQWILQPAGAASVTFTLTLCHLERFFDTVYVYDGATTNAPLLVAVTGYGYPTTVSSTGPVMLVRFVSDVNVQKVGFAGVWRAKMPTLAASPEPGTSNPTCVQNCWNGQCQGDVCVCSAGFSGVDCSVPYCNGTVTLTTPTGQIASSGGGVYRPSMNCMWLIQPVPALDSMTLWFDHIDLNEGDTVTIFAGPDTTGQQLGQYTGSTKPADVITQAPAVTVVFTSTPASDKKLGFTIQYEPTNEHHTNAASVNAVGIWVLIVCCLAAWGATVVA